MIDDNAEVTVVGGGLAGLTAAVVAAQAGAVVTLYEARDTAGGRARTTRHGEFRFNQGPHALYRAGAARRILSELGIDPAGHTPNIRGYHFDVDGQLRSASRPGTFGFSAGRSLISALRQRDHAGASVADTLAHLGPDARSRVACLVRLATYVEDLDELDAGAASAQLRLATRSVRYLDGGWESLVDGLVGLARAGGVTIETAHRVNAVTAEDPGRGFTVATNSSTRYADSVVLAQGGPAHAAALTGGASRHLSAAAAAARPVTASCLDVALDATTSRGVAVSLGLNDPTYVVDHAATARLAPEGAHIIHAMWYGGDASIDRRPALEDALDRSWPGWRGHVVEARWSRSLVVAHDRPHPGAPPVTHEVPDSAGLFVAGDWITAAGMLADAAVQSGQQAGLAAANSLTRRRSLRPQPNPARLGGSR